MAKKKKRGKVKYRRMGQATLTATLKKNEEVLYLGAGVVVGAVAKGFIDQALAKQDTIKVNQNMVDGAQFAAGVAGALYLKGSFLKGLAIGVGSAGAVSGLRGLGVIKGGVMPMVPFRPRPNQARTALNGASQTPNVGGANVYGYPQAPTVGVGRSLRRKVASY